MTATGWVLLTLLLLAAASGTYLNARKDRHS